MAGQILNGETGQYAQPQRQPTELVLAIRKAFRTSKEWGLPFHLVKIDVAKAFESVDQVCMAKLVADNVGREGNKPWEALLWVDMLVNTSLTITPVKWGQTGGPRHPSHLCSHDRPGPESSTGPSCLGYHNVYI